MVANLLKAVLHYSGFAEEGTISWYVGGNMASHTNADMDAWAAEIANQMTTSTTPSTKTGILGRLAAGQTVDEITCYEYAASGGAATAVGHFAPSGWVGTKTTQLKSLQVAQVATLRTAGSGRSFRGRQYWPCQGLSLTAQCQFGTADTDALALLAANAGSDVDTATIPALSISTPFWGVFSRKLNILTPIVEVAVDSKPDTQRRRAFSQVATYSTTVSA